MHLITRSIEIDMGHRLPKHGGKCASMHGHRYKIIAAVRAKQLQSEMGEKAGMVEDFGTLKQIMLEMIHEDFDHGFVWHIDDPLMTLMYTALYIHTGLNKIPLSQVRSILETSTSYVLTPIAYARVNGESQKIVFMSAPPTAENLARLWYNLMRGRVAGLEYVEVWETPNCSARFNPNE